MVRSPLLQCNHYLKEKDNIFQIQHKAFEKTDDDDAAGKIIIVNYRNKSSVFESGFAHSLLTRQERRWLWLLSVGFYS